MKRRLLLVLPPALSGALELLAGTVGNVNGICVLRSGASLAARRMAPTLTGRAVAAPAVAKEAPAQRPYRPPQAVVAHDREALLMDKPASTFRNIWSKQFTN